MVRNIEDLLDERNTRNLKSHLLDKKILEEIRFYHNPKKLSVGHYTGRCLYCHSNNLWDDMTTYGCNTCDAIYSV